jgi:hypothetical protein
MTDKTADLLNLCLEQCIKPLPCLCDACFADVPVEEWTAEPMLPPVSPFKLAQHDCIAQGRCPHQDHCLDQHRCKSDSVPVLAANMHRECLRDGWIMGEHPVRFLRGNDHE